jgi:hypothetical protein
MSVRANNAHLTSVRRVLGLLILAALLAGCRVDTRVEVTVAADGSGLLVTHVTLDAEALARVGGVDKATQQIPVSDLEAAGWKVGPWVNGEGGGVTREFAHPFANESDLANRLVDLFGAQGAVRSPEFSRNKGWLDTSSELTLLVDMQAPTTGIGSDDDLKARLAFAGVDVAALDEAMTNELRDDLHLTVVANLPDGTKKTYEVKRGEVRTVRAEESELNWDRAIKLGIALCLFAIAGTFLLAASMSARRNRTRQVQRRTGPRAADHERAPLM